jgi:hypothetical protein
VDIPGRFPTGGQDRILVLDAKVPIFTGQKKIEAVSGQGAEEEVAAVWVSRRERVADENPNRT